MAVTVDIADFVREQQLDIRLALDPITQVARHGDLETLPTYGKMHAPGALREDERCLPRRVRPADDDYGFSRPKLLTRPVGRKCDAEPLIIGDMRDRQPAVLHAERQDH